MDASYIPISKDRGFTALSIKKASLCDNIGPAEHPLKRCFPAPLLILKERKKEAARRVDGGARARFERKAFESSLREAEKHGTDDLRLSA